MKLKRKLMLAYVALSLMTLTAAALTAWITIRWQASKEMLEDHYRRSLLVQDIRAATFHAFKEVPDAVTGDDPQSREEFVRYMAPAYAAFEDWRALAHSEDEWRQIALVTAAHTALVRDADAAFSLVEQGRMREAFELMEGRLEDRGFVEFTRLTEAATASDRRQRELVRAENQRTRRSAQVVLALVAFGALSLVLLLAAYLASDLFRPLRAVETALDDLARGEAHHRLDEGADDEIGAINRAYNRMADAVAAHDVRPRADHASASAAASGLAHQVAALRARLGNPSTDEDAAAIDAMLAAIADGAGRASGLDLVSTDVRALVYDVLLRFHPAFGTRAVSLEVKLAPEVDHAFVDPLRLRAALSAVIERALSALAPRGGALGVRASLDGDGKALLVEVVDNGTVMATPDDAADDLADGYRNDDLVSAREIVARHGGRLTVSSEAPHGTYVRIRLPLQG